MDGRTRVKQYTPPKRGYNNVYDFMVESETDYAVVTFPGEIFHQVILKN